VQIKKWCKAKSIRAKRHKTNEHKTKDIATSILRRVPEVLLVICNVAKTVINALYTS
jgi:hypothetical protein